MFITKKHLSRRTVLRGMGVSIALPLLDAMIPAHTALAKTAAAPMPRIGFTYFPHGAIMARWQPKETGTTFELPQILKPFEPYRNHMTVVTGLRNKAGESPSPHAIIAGTWLGCVAPAVSQAPHGGTSADQIAAQHIGQDTTLPSIELAGEGGGGACDPQFGCSYSGTIAFRTPTQPLPMEHNPRKAFYRLFGQGDNAAERHAIVEETGSILDMVAENAADLKRQLGTTDQAMVDDYLDSVREIERRVQKQTEKESSGVKLPDARHHVRDDRAGLPGQRHARHHLHDGQGSQHEDVQPDRRAGCVPSALASPERRCEARPSREGSGVPQRSVRALPEAHGRHAGWRRVAPGSLDHALRQQHE
jgi:hypothetical protein